MNTNKRHYSSGNVPDQAAMEVLNTLAWVWAFENAFVIE